MNRCRAVVSLVSQSGVLLITLADARLKRINVLEELLIAGTQSVEAGLTLRHGVEVILG